MSMLKRLFGNTTPDPKTALIPLYNQIVAKAREPHWYVKGQVPDSMDGRFDMVATILTIVLLRLEQDKTRAQDMAYLTEVFVDDMDGQLRESGIGDMIVGKHIGRIMGAVGGRLAAFRQAMGDADTLDQAITRNIYRSETVAPQALAHVRQALLDLEHSLAMQPADAIAGGSAAW